MKDRIENGNCACLEEQIAGDNSAKQGMMEQMQKCMKGGKWFLLLPGVIIITAFLLTYFLDAEVVRVLWLVVTGAFTALGLLFYVLMNIWVGGLVKSKDYNG